MFIPPLLEPAVRMLLAIVFGSIIGVERQWRHKKAGIKTNTLVALGAAGFALMSARGFGPSSNPAQLAAAVVTGIGFIGAGVIIHRGANVQGVDTAATLWANASMGVALGAGHYDAGTTIFLAILIVQFGARRLAWYIDCRANTRRPTQAYDVRVFCEAESLEAIEKCWSEFAERTHIVAEQRSVTHGSFAVGFTSRSDSMKEIPSLEARLLAIDGVRKVETRRVDAENSELSLS